MLTPKDKLESGVNDIIQVEITRACSLYTCSNCTRLLPFRQDTLHMSLDVFRQAVRSLIGWPGVISLFGGNPNSHPRFEEICEIFCQEVPNQKQRGLWTNDLLGKGEASKTTFWPHGRFNLNVHENSKAADEMRKWLPGIAIVGEQRASWHAPILMNYRDYGISDAEWVSMRERCDINQRWSASIVERDGKAVAHFCEIASALDGIRGLNHGVEAVPGWWRMPMNYFHEQVRKCCDAGCGVPLKRKGSLDSDEIYDVSPSFLPIVVNPKRVSIRLHEMMPEATVEVTDYQGARTAK